MLSGIVAIAVILVWFHGVLGPVPDVVAAEQQLAPITTVYIVRHAERADDSANTPLSAAGRARAQELVHVLGNDDLDAVFVTNLTRTQQTGAPPAAARGIMAEQYPSISFPSGRHTARIPGTNRRLFAPFQRKAKTRENTPVPFFGCVMMGRLRTT